MARILLIEDDTPLLHLYQDALSQAHEVMGVETWEDALPILQGHTVDVVVLDLNLPDASGAQVMKYLASQPHLSHIRVVAMTGFDHYHKEEFGRLGVQVVSKPVTSSMILRAVQTSLDNAAHSSGKGS